MPLASLLISSLPDLPILPSAFFISFFFHSFRHFFWSFLSWVSSSAVQPFFLFLLQFFLLLRLVPSFYPSEQAGETGGWAAEGRRDGD